MTRVTILDGYTDEPAGLGVPPYIGVYPRLVAGAVWMADKEAVVKYWAIDSARRDMDAFVRDARASDLLVVIAGAEVPGRYIGGKPLSLKELEEIMLLVGEHPRSLLVGPAARFGLGTGGGSAAVTRRRLSRYFTEIVPGDPEIYIYRGLAEGWEKAAPYAVRRDYQLTDKAYRYGAHIITQHPNHGWNLVVEIETYRGCPRYVSGGCSFCLEPRRGPVVYRSIEGIINEVEALYRYGARHIRLGMQSDILAYMATDTGREEYPRPNPGALEKLLRGIWGAAPGLRVLHIDNVNPGTIAHHPREAMEALKVIVKHHTPGDVAAMGIESFDPRVVRANNLKVYPDEALEAVRIVNKVGAMRGWNGMPELLPGINLLYGLLGETRETYHINLSYLHKILDEGLLVRRINIRMVSVLENTPLWLRRDIVESIIRKHHRLYQSHRRRVMEEIDRPMMRRILPPGTILRYLYTEKHVGSHTYARQPGSYPVLVKIRGNIPLRKIVDARITGHAAKSVVGELVESNE